MCRSWPPPRPGDMIDRIIWRRLTSVSTRVWAITTTIDNKWLWWKSNIDRWHPVFLLFFSLQLRDTRCVISRSWHQPPGVKTPPRFSSYHRWVNDSHWERARRAKPAAGILTRYARHLYFLSLSLLPSSSSFCNARSTHKQRWDSNGKESWWSLTAGLPHSICTSRYTLCFSFFRNRAGL